MRIGEKLTIFAIIAILASIAYAILSATYAHAGSRVCIHHAEIYHKGCKE